MANESGFTHVDQRGRANMVDVSAKPSTHRRAVARCSVFTTSEVDLDEPSLLMHAQIAGIQAAKATSQLIPLCHPLLLDGVELELRPTEGEVVITATAEVTAKTGVEMEALCACALAGLSVVAALLESDPLAEMTGLTLVHKSGGRTGTWDLSGSAGER
jgi:cyclic pyranopterin phosphate synthase